MSVAAAVWLVLALAVLTANLPFVSQRLALIGPKRLDKPLGWRLLELLALCALTLVIGRLLEARMGQAHSQGWEFYAAMGCLFLTLAFPGFVWRQLRRGA